MRIVTIYDTLPPAPDGGADFAVRLAMELQARGHSHCFIVPPGRRGERSALEAGEVIESERLWEDGSPRAVREALALVNRQRCDVLHVIYPGKTSRPYALPLGIVAARRVPTVLTNFAFGPRAIHHKDLLRLPFALQSLRAIVVCAADQRRWLNLLAPWLRARTAVIPSGGAVPGALSSPSSAARARRALGLPTGSFYIGYFGYVYRGKRPGEIVQACDTLVQEGLDARVVLIGGQGLDAEWLPGARRDVGALEGEIRRRGLEARVHVTGYVDPDLATRYICACDVIVYPVNRFAVGRSTSVAALSLGVPLIAPRPRPYALPPNAEPWGNLLFYSPGRRGDDLVSRLRMLAADASLRDKLREGATALAPAWSWPALAARYEAVFASASGQ